MARVTLLSRGVYRADHLDAHGDPYWFAVDSRGRRVFFLPVAEQLTEVTARRLTLRVLDNMDPAIELLPSQDDGPGARVIRFPGARPQGATT